MLNINYLSYVDKADYLGIEAKTKFNQYITETEEGSQECTDCKLKLIIINNSSQLNGLHKFMISGKELLNQNIKIYLYKRSGLDLIIGPIYIESIDKINNIIYYIVHFITRDSFTKHKEDIDNDIIKTFNNNEDIILFYN